MAITDNWGYVKRMIAGSLGLLMLPSAASAESKFLSLGRIFASGQMEGSTVSA